MPDENSTPDISLDTIKSYLTENQENEEVKVFLDSFNQVNAEKVKKFLESPNGMPVKQSIVDSAKQKGVDEWKNKYLSEAIEEEIAKRFPPETEEQKKLQEFEQKLRKIEREKQEITLKNHAIAQLEEAGLSSRWTDYVIGESEEQTSERIKQVQELINADVNRQVDERIKGSSRQPQQSSGDETRYTRESLKSMPREKIAELTQEGKLNHLLGVK